MHRPLKGAAAGTGHRLDVGRLGRLMHANMLRERWLTR